MKKYFSIFIFIATFSMCNNALSQSAIDMEIFKNYLNFSSIGKYKNGIKIGKWIDLSQDSIVYAESWYDSLGQPTGTWKVNFPNGSLRREIKYDKSLVVRWTMYRYRLKVAEVVNDSIGLNDILSKINTFELNSYQSEMTVVHVYSQSVYNRVGYRDYVSIRDPFELAINIREILLSNKFEGVLINYNEDQTIRRKSTFNKVHEYRISFFYNSKKILTKQEEYLDEKVVKVVKFNRDGQQKITNY